MIRNIHQGIARAGKNIFHTLILLVIFSLYSVCIAYAGENTVKVSLPVAQEFRLENTISDSVNKAVKCELTAMELDNPMPEGSNNGRYIFTLEDEISLDFSYSQVGVYRYQLRQTATDDKQYTYDKTVYTISVYVKNTGSGQLISQVIVENEHGAKCEKLLFQNTFIGKKNSTGDDPSKQDTSAEDSTSTRTTPPDTGDDTNIVAYLALLLISFLAIVKIMTMRRN